MSTSSVALEFASSFFLEAEKEDHRQFMRIADKIEADPSLLAIALDNIKRWSEQGDSNPPRLEGWRRIVEAAQQSQPGLDRLLALLRDRSPESMQWKGFSPFPGVLSPEDF